MLWIVFFRGGVEDTRLEAKTKAKDAEKFRGQGQGQTLSRPRPRTKDTDASVLQKKRSSKIFFRRKRSSKIFFKRSLFEEIKKSLCRYFARFLAFSNKILTVQKWCCPRAEDRAFFEDLRLRGQGQGQGQRLQNVFSRTSLRPRTSSRTPPLVFFVVQTAVQMSFCILLLM